MELIETTINPGIIKMYILSFGVKISNTFLQSLDFNFIQENGYYYNVSNPSEIIKRYKIPSEILLPNDVECSIYINNYSPIELKNDKGTYIVTFNNKYLSSFEFNQKSDFFYQTDDNGIQLSKYVSMYGRHILGLFVNGHCEYINQGKACKFCSLGYGRFTVGKNNIDIIETSPLDNVIKKVSKLDKGRIKYLMYTSGTYSDLDFGILEQAKLINVCNKYFDNKKYTHHLTTMPPMNKNTLVSLKKSGLNSIAYDIEVFDENLFNFFCPGKSLYYGYKEFISMCIDSVEIFGKNNVKVGFVGGLEPISSMKRGMELFAKEGCSIAVNIFHPDQGCELSNYGRPTITYLKDMVCMQRDLYKKYDIIPVFPVGGRRSSLDTEIYRGFFDEI